MSDEVWVKVNFHHSGQFKREKDVLDYVDGMVDVVEVDSATIFSSILLKLLEKKIDSGKMWWKLPFEDVEDKKPLWENLDVNKQKMRTAARWGKELDIYIEKSDVDENLSDEEDDETYNPEGEISDDEDKGSEEALSDATDSDGDVEVDEEETEVFDSNNYEEQIVDEDEVYPATDDSSGDEEDHAERLVKKDLLDGVFSLKQLFSTGTEFKKNVIKYVLKTRRNVVFNRWEKTKLEAECREKGCGWRVYCAMENPIGKWMVKAYEDEHQCHATGRCKLIRSPVIADIFLEDIRKDPQMSAPEIKDEMKKRYNIIISPPQSQTARRMTFDKLQAECDKQFSRLRDYELNLTKHNPGTTIEINTTRRDDGSEAFSQIYICFEPLRSSWKKNCRPIIGLDGTFLKNSVQGMMLTAIGRDPNNQIYPIAWGVVDAENNPNWEWFIHKLKIDLGLGLGEDITIISDMHRSLIHGVSTELPMAEHRACARHIYSNLKKFHKSDMLKPLFWRVASSYNEADFRTNLEQFKEFDPKACDDLMKKDPHTWCRAFFRIGCCCADTHNNHTESFNRTIKTARKKPFVQMLELIRRDAMQRIANRFKIASKEVAKHTKKARKEVQKSCDEAQHCNSISSTGGKYEIVEFGNGYSVSLSRRTCACRKWDLTGIPCRHAVCAIRENNMDVEDFISDFYLTEKWQETYMRGLSPVNGPKFWISSGGGLIVAPAYKRPPGRPKGKARIKSVHESPSKKKVSRVGRVSHCGLCGEKGHNIRRCPHESEESRAKRRRLNEEARVATQMAAQVETQDEAEMEAEMRAQEEARVEVHDVSSTAPSGSQMEWLLFG